MKCRVLSKQESVTGNARYELCATRVDEESDDGDNEGTLGNVHVGSAEVEFWSSSKHIYITT